MNAAVRRPPVDRGRSGAAVVALDAARIERALAARSRYRYVKPRLEAEGQGWKILSANCSRKVDPAGGEIAIAWFEPEGGGRWRLHARDHVEGRWTLQGQGLTLEQALAQVCSDTQRVFWP
ncbi:hypothetical protein CKO44_06285 [Rubrivivax gelatinosus]|uniref:DUF3024 domain-containing protein n=1 Tax=Rubrivivax gelatinosus TaxID=28068 RepID=UPI0019037490|nr:hypothetical protein [Rubrivivax gelatinosus]MBK1613081.1 hypothetical protein [Rubrivivax gelatinosus]